MNWLQSAWPRSSSALLLLVPGPDFAKALGLDYVFRAEPARVTLACTTCAGAPIVDVLLGTQTDGTEGRVRSGVTTIETPDAQC